MQANRLGLAAAREHFWETAVAPTTKTPRLDFGVYETNNVTLRDGMKDDALVTLLSYESSAPSW